MADTVASVKKLTREDSIELKLVVDILLLDLGVRRNVDRRRGRHNESTVVGCRN